MVVRYRNDFTGANGSAPTEYTLSEAGGGTGSRDIQSNEFRMLNSTTAGNVQRAILPAANWSYRDGRITAEVTFQAGTSQAIPQVYMRTSGDWSAGETDSPTTGYKWIAIQSGGICGLYRMTAGSGIQMGSDVSVTFTTAIKYTMILEVSGSGPTLVRAKFFPSTAGEPGWQISQTDTTVPAVAGQTQLAQLGQLASQDARWNYVELDDLSSIAPGSRPSRRISM